MTKYLICTSTCFKNQTQEKFVKTSKIKIVQVRLPINVTSGQRQNWENYSRGFNGDATILLVLSCVCKPGLTSLSSSNDTSFTDKGICQCGLAMVNMSNNRHVSDIFLVVHDLTDLVYGKVHLKIKINKN